MDLEDQDEVKADPFADEPEEEIEVLQREGNVLDGREECQEQILDTYSPNYANPMHDNPARKPDTMHDSLQPINMHDADSSYFTNSTNFSNDAYSADLNQLLTNPQLWTFPPAPIYDPLQNFNSFNHFNPVPSYPYPHFIGYPQPSNYQPSNYTQPVSYPQPEQSRGHLSHPLPSPPATNNSPSSSSDGLPLLSPIPTLSLPDGLPPLPPIPTPSLSDTLLLLPPVPGNPPSDPAGLPQKAAGGKAKHMASTSQPEPTTRKSRHPPKPSTRNKTTNAIGTNALSEMWEKENTATMGGKQAHKHRLEAGGEPIAKHCAHFVRNDGH
ncbi:hypothetical protein BD769DRAFT_1388947 [Suillus cothurnatus]|nr:hypothetical protein BD769DRAFT_1388947 [Suillus cothurnatus]